MVIFGFLYYVVSKVGVNGFICVVVLELVGDGIIVNGVEFGLVVILVLGSFGDVVVLVVYIFFGCVGQLLDIVYVMFFFVFDEVSYIIGQILVVDGGVLLLENGGLV